MFSNTFRSILPIPLDLELDDSRAARPPSACWAWPHAPDDEQRRAGLQDRVVELNMQIAVDVARRYRSRGVAAEDLEQVAYLGLVKAVRGFDPERATDFLSYAVPTIRGEVRRYFRDHGWVVRPPRTVQQAQARITSVESDLCQELGRAPRPSEIAERLGLDLDLVVEALAANGCFARPRSTARRQRASPAIGDRLGDDDASFDSAEARVALKPLGRPRALRAGARVPAHSLHAVRIAGEPGAQAGRGDASRLGQVR